jgi:hypothetical protein
MIYEKEGHTGIRGAAMPPLTASIRRSGLDLAPLRAQQT